MRSRPAPNLSAAATNTAAMRKRTSLAKGHRGADDLIKRDRAVPAVPAKTTLAVEQNTITVRLFRADAIRLRAMRAAHPKFSAQRFIRDAVRAAISAIPSTQESDAA